MRQTTGEDPVVVHDCSSSYLPALPASKVSNLSVLLLVLGISYKQCSAVSYDIKPQRKISLSKPQYVSFIYSCLFKVSLSDQIKMGIMEIKIEEKARRPRRFLL